MYRTRPGLSLVETLVVIAVTAVVFGLLLPAVQAARGAALRLRCANNLRQVGLGLHQYHDAADRLPPGTSYQADQAAYPWMTWCVRVLPYLEQDGVWRQAVTAYAANKSFYAESHAAPRATALAAFTCPVDPNRGATAAFGKFEVAFTSYLGVHGTDQSTRDGVLYLDSKVQLTHITDGTSQTVMVGERPPSPDSRFGWFYAGLGQQQDGAGDATLGARDWNRKYPLPTPLGPYHFGPGRTGTAADTFHFWSAHSGGAHFLFADGGVRFLRYDADAVLPALATRAGGEGAEVP